MTDTVVAIASCTGYRQKEVDAVIKKLINIIGVPDFHGRQILIKPNILTDSHPKKAVTTHPTVAAAVCSYVIDHGGKPVMGDSPSIQRKGFSPERSGLAEVCRRFNVPWIDFTKDTTEITGSNFAVQKRFTVAKVALESDFIINLPKLKTHQLMYMTGAVKNLFGLVPGLGKSPYHLKYSGRDQFADMLIDLNSILSPVIHIMDAVISMEGEGPSNGNPKKTGILLAAKNPYSMDLAALRIMGEDSEQIPVMRRAHSRGFLPSFDSRTLTYPLEAAENVAAEDFKLIPKRGKNGFLAIAASYFMRIFPSGKHPEPAPYIEQSRCIACLACFEICPADAVKKKNSAQGKNTLLEIESRSCIRCYCCHEVCPVHAVKVDSDKSLKS